MPERLKAILDKITAWWKKFNTKQRSVLISIVAVVIVALVILGVVISRPTQVELVEAQSASEASTIKGVLEDNNISYEVDSKLVFFVNKSDEVIAGAYLSALSTMTNLKILPSIPYIAVDMAASILSVPAIQFGQYGDNALFIETEFGDDIMMNGYFILMPDPDSYDNILSALGISF